MRLMVRPSPEPNFIFLFFTGARIYLFYNHRIISLVCVCVFSVHLSQRIFSGPTLFKCNLPVQLQLVVYQWCKLPHFEQGSLKQRKQYWGQSQNRHVHLSLIFRDRSPKIKKGNHWSFLSLSEKWSFSCCLGRVGQIEKIKKKNDGGRALDSKIKDIAIDHFRDYLMSTKRNGNNWSFC